nr:hypothetical protein [Tanacetum cinerariifolium]
QFAEIVKRGPERTVAEALVVQAQVADGKDLAGVDVVDGIAGALVAHGVLGNLLERQRDNPVGKAALGIFDGELVVVGARLGAPHLKRGAGGSRRCHRLRQRNRAHRGGG